MNALKITTKGKTKDGKIACVANGVLVVSEHLYIIENSLKFIKFFNCQSHKEYEFFMSSANKEQHVNVGRIRIKEWDEFPWRREVIPDDLDVLDYNKNP